MARKTGLGRGLDALIPGSEPSFASGVETVPIDQVIPNPRQPRTNFDPEGLHDLTESIREYGVIQPIILTRGDGQDTYILIAGERRLMAARQAGLNRIPAIVRDASELQRLELALIENVQRSDLGPLETADAYRQLVDDFGLSHEEVAGHVGKSRTAVTNTLRLLKLSPAVKEALAAGAISEGHARNLLALSSPQAQSAALKTIIDRGLNVRQTEELVRRLSGEKPVPKPKPEPPPEIKDLQSRLESSLGTRVRLNRGKKGGTLVIHFYSDEELDVLVDRIARDIDVIS